MRHTEPTILCIGRDWSRKRSALKPARRNILLVGRIFAVCLGVLAFSAAFADSQISVPVSAGKIVWSPITKLLYALVPASDAAGDKSNTLTVIDPFSGKIVFSKFAGGELNTMAFSGNYRYLYIALGNSIRVFNTADNSLGSMAPIGAGLSVAGMCAAPGLADCVLIQQQNRGYSPSDNGAAVVKPDGSLMKKTQHSGHSIVYDRLTDRAFGYENEISNWDLPMLGTDAEGVVRLGDANGMLMGNVSLQAAENGLLFTNNGNVLDPIFKISLGHFGSLGWQSRISADGSTGKAYSISEKGGTASIDVYDMYTMAKTNTILVGLGSTSGGAPTRRRPGDSGGLGDPVRFGDDGLAFRAGANIWLVRSAMVGPVRGPSDLAVTTTGLPAAIKPGDTLSCTAKVTNRSTSTAIGVVLTDLITDNVDIVNLSASQGTPTASNHGARLEIESLAPGAQASVNLEVKVKQLTSDQVASSPGLIQTAFVRSQLFDPHPENNHAVQQAKILAPPAASVAAATGQTRQDHGAPARPAEPAPDLTCEWKWVKETSEGSGSDIHHFLTGELEVRNQGNMPAPQSKLRLFVSATAGYNPTFAILLQEGTVPPLKPGAKHTAQVKARLRFGDDVIGLYIIALVNADKKVKESDTSNNLAAIRVP